MISLAWKKRAIPLYWKILTHKGASNLTEQKAVIRPVIAHIPHFILYYKKLQEDIYLIK